jgi:hypothetical protein
MSAILKVRKRIGAKFLFFNLGNTNFILGNTTIILGITKLQVAQNKTVRFAERMGPSTSIKNGTP